MSDSTALSVFDNQGLDEQQRHVCTLIATGKSIEKACQLAGVTEYRYTKWLAELPAFEQAVRRARAIIVDRRVDRIAEVARTEPDVNRAALIIKTDQWLASKLIPKVYGDRLDLNITQTIDIGSALAEARNRAALRPRCDPDNVIDGQAIDITGRDDASSVDKQSSEPSLPDIFE